MVLPQKEIKVFMKVKTRKRGKTQYMKVPIFYLNIVNFLVKTTQFLWVWGHMELGWAMHVWCHGPMFICPYVCNCMGLQNTFWVPVDVK